MGSPADRTLRRTLAPAAAILALAALADRAGADGLTFYLFLLGIPLSAGAALAAFARVVDAAAERRPVALGRFQAWTAASLVGVFVLGAAARSPVLLEVGGPGLAPAVVVLGFVLVGLLVLAASASPARR
jgi:hypothetical protein